MAETTFTPALDALSFRDLLDRVSDLVQSHQPNGQIQFLNESWLNRLGYTKAETSGRNILDFIHADGRDNYTNYVKRLLGNEDIGPVEVLFATKDGEPLALEGRMSVQRDANTSIAIPIAIHGQFHGHFPDFAATKLDHSTPTRTQRLFESVLAILRANSSLDRTVFLDLVTRNVAQALDVARVSVWLFDDARKHIRCEFLFADGAPQDCAGLSLARNDHSAYFDAIEGASPVRADDAHTHIATRSFSANYLTPLHISSMLDAPIRLGNNQLGVLCCEHTGPIRHWKSDEEEFTLGVSALVLIFLENQLRLDSDRKLQEANQQLECLINERTTTLAQTEQRLRYVLTSAPTVLYSCAPSGDFHSTYISPNVEAKLGYPVQSYFDDPNFWMDHIHPADAAGVHGMYERATELGSGSFEYRYRFPDGQYHWLRDEFVVLRDESGKPLQIVGSCVNIDDRRCAQDAAQAAAHDIRRLIDTANAPIFGKDIHHHVNEWNHCAERCTGYMKNEVIGRQLTDFVEPQFRTAVAKVLENALLGIETANFEFPIIAKDGRHLLLLLNASTRRDANGTVTGMLGVGQDITERRETELSLIHI
jgi:PAS domain S-box-containing protein